MFKKPKATVAAKKTEKTMEAEPKILKKTQKQKRKEGNFSTAKFFDGDGQNPSKLTRENSSRRTGNRQQNQSSEHSKTERSSKEMIQKYLNLIKPLYAKVSKRYGEKVKPSGEVTMSSPACSPAMPIPSMCSPKDKPGNIPAGIRLVCKNLVKSKSVTSAAPPLKRRDDSLLLQNDGIQSAILHCKRSFNSRDSSLLSRSNSDFSSMHSYSTDSSLLSRFASEPHDKSARSSIEEGYAGEIRI